MSYSSSNRSRTSKKKEIHPIWRGVGCFMILLIPVLAFALGRTLLTLNLRGGWIPMPAEMFQTYTIPVINLTVKYFIATMVFTLFFIVVLAALFTAAYSIFFRVDQQAKKDPLYVPPIRKKQRRKR